MLVTRLGMVMLARLEPAIELIICQYWFPESSHVIPALITKVLQRFPSSRIIPNLPEKRQTVSDCSIRFAAESRNHLP
jgi:hypothetical protein